MYTQMNELFMSVRVSLHVLSSERRGRLVGISRFFLRFRRSRIRWWSFLHGRLSGKILSLPKDVLSHIVVSVANVYFYHDQWTKNVNLYTLLYGDVYRGGALLQDV